MYARRSREIKAIRQKEIIPRRNGSESKEKKNAYRMSGHDRINYNL